MICSLFMIYFLLLGRTFLYCLVLFPTALFLSSSSPPPRRQVFAFGSGDNWPHWHYNGTCDTAQTHTCFIIAWCPSAVDASESPTANVLPTVASFLLKTRATIKFPFNGLVTSNTRGGRGEVPGLNIFEVSAILNATNTSFDEVAQDGAVFSIGFNWD